MKPKRKLNKYQKLVEKFVKEKGKYLAKKDWGLEVKTGKKLYEIYPDEQFWLNLVLPFKLNSLAWFLSDEGKKHLSTSKLKNNLSLKRVNRYILEEEPEKYNIPDPKPKTIIEFINYGKTQS